MNKFTITDIVLAFAGIQQTAVLIQQLVSTGRCDEQAFNASINSLYAIDSPDVPTIFGGKSGVRLGLTSLKNMFNMKAQTIFEKQVARHVIGMIHVERHLYRDAAMQNSLLKKIRYAQNQAEFFNPTHPNVIASLAKIYEDTVGKLTFKIGIIGKRDILSNPDIMQKVRALLLAGIRSAVLWQQVGGNRWQLIWNRRRYRNAIEKMG
ncbi:MAG: high frequency lysogenization protein HflD [Gammaproteobacteria bacterium]